VPYSDEKVNPTISRYASKAVPSSAQADWVHVNRGGKFDEESAQSASIGRWPANLLLDEESANILGEPSRFFYTTKTSTEEREAGLSSLPDKYIAKGNQAQAELKRGNTEFSRNTDTGGQNKVVARKNSHPTVKPVSLMSYLCKLVTPEDGVVLDPFMGSGSTGIAAVISGFNFVGIEISEEYVEIARLRIEHNLRSRFDI
jgi:adenine specific DNA methylase Mod